MSSNQAGSPADFWFSIRAETFLFSAICARMLCKRKHPLCVPKPLFEEQKDSFDGLQYVFGMYKHIPRLLAWFVVFAICVFEPFPNKPKWRVTLLSLDGDIMQPSREAVKLVLYFWSFNVLFPCLCLRNTPCIRDIVQKSSGYRPLSSLCVLVSCSIISVPRSVWSTP